MVLTGKMFEKHLWNSELKVKMQVIDVTLPQVFFKHFASKTQELPGFYISGELVEN